MIILVKKYIVSICVVMVIGLLLQGCSSEKSNNSSVKSNSNQSQTLISYDNYKKLFNDMSEKFLPAGFSKEAATDNVSIVAINKESSFGKRENLTVDGKQSDQETQKRIAYEDKEHKYILFIDIIYLNKELDKDLVYWNTNFLEKYKNNSLISKFDDNILSYHNLLIKMTMFSEGESSAISSDVIRKSTLEMVKFLDNYKFS